MLFQISPSGMYLEDDAQQAEVPDENGGFTLTEYRYRVCGDDNTPSSSNLSSPPPPAWNMPIQWHSKSQGRRIPFQGNKQSIAGPSTPQYETAFFKRCIPLVVLNLSKSGKKIIVDHNEENIFVKIPENALSVDAILDEVGKKVSLPSSDLVLLDSSFLTVSDENGQFELV